MFEIKGDYYLLMQSTSSTRIAHLTAGCFSIFGPPMEIVTDNRPQYAGKPYNDLCSKWSIKHTTTSPSYAQSKGLVKKQVRTVKGIIQKCSKTRNDIQIGMQHLRCTLVPCTGQALGPSPARPAGWAST